MAEDQDVAVAIAQMREQMNGVMGTLEEIKESMAQLISIDRTVAELLIHKDSAKRDIEMLWTRLDDAKVRDDKLKERIDIVDREHEKFVNTFNGGMRVFLTIAGILQASVIGAVIWAFTHIGDADTLNRVQEQRIQVLEQQVRDLVKELRK